MTFNVATLLEQGILRLRQGQDATMFLQEPAVAALSSKEREELQQLLQFARQLDELARQPVPSPQRTNADRARFLSAAVAQRETYHSTGLSRAWSGRMRQWLLGPALSLLLLMCVGLGAVSAAVDSLPGSTLYPLKIAAEEIRLNVALTPPTRTRLHIQFAHERGYEMLRLAATQQQIDGQVVQRMAAEWDGAMRAALAAPTGSQPALLSQVHEGSLTQAETLRSASAEAKPPAAAILASAAQIAEQTAAEAEQALDELEGGLPPVVATVTPTSSPELTPTTEPTLAVLPTDAISPTATPSATEVATIPAPETTVAVLSRTPTSTGGSTASPTPSKTLLPTHTTQPAPTHISLPSATATRTAAPTLTQTATPSAVPSATHTPLVSFRLTLEDTPDPVPATYRIYYSACVLNQGNVPLSNVVLTAVWSPRECVYYLPLNPEKLTWELGAIEPGLRSCVNFALNTYSICGGSTVTAEVSMGCDQGTAYEVEHTRIGPTPTPIITPTETATPTPTATGTPEVTGTPSPSASAEVTATLTVTLPETAVATSTGTPLASPDSPAL